MAKRTLVDTKSGLHDAIDAIVSASGPIAVDAERASGFRYSQRAYLIQLYREGAGTYLVDPPAVGSLKELNSEIADTEWVLHAASQDLECLRETDLSPQTIFDTELASRLLGLPKVGLGTVTEELLGIHLAKEHSAADWSTRPLPESWLNYAALDVEYLIELRQVLTQMLVEQNKTEIARQEFQAELDKPPTPPRAEPWRRLSGIHTVKSAQRLAVARSLWYARDALARERDVAPGRLIPDSAITAVAREVPDSKGALARRRDFMGRASRSELDRWWNAIVEGLADDDPPQQKHRDGKLPPTRSWHDKRPDAAARLQAAKTVLSTISDDLAIPVENLLKPDYVRHLAWEPPQLDGSGGAVATALAQQGARPWQLELLAGRLATALVAADKNQELQEPPSALSS